MPGFQSSKNTPIKNSFSGENHLEFSTNPIDVPVLPGVVSWNTVDGCLDIQQLNGTILQVGQEQYFYGKASGDILNGDVCMFAGAQGNHILIKKITASDITTVQLNPHYLIGIATDNITNGNYGYVTWFGKVNGTYTKTPLNKASVDWIEGDILYFSNTTEQLTKTAPTAPNRTIIVAAVIAQQSGSSETGILIVRPSYNGSLMQLDDVDGTPLDTTGQLLIWNETNKYWDPSDKVYLDEEAVNGPVLGTNQDSTSRDLHVNCGTDKTVVLDESVWLDIDFPILIRTTGVGIPTLTTVYSGTYGNITMPQWEVNDLNVCESQEFVHMWKEGSPAYWHIHLTTNGLDTTNRYVRFGLSYGYNNGAGTTWTFTNLDSGDLLIPANTPDKTMLIFSIGNFTPTNAKIGAHSVALLKRIASTGTAPTSNPWVPMLQMHIECDTLGSRQIGTK